MTRSAAGEGGRVALLVIALAIGLSPLAFAAAPVDEWESILADYKWLDALRKSAPPISPDLPRKDQIEAWLQNERKFEPVYGRFIDKLENYYHRTGDPRAAALFAREKIRLGDGYMDVLARYDRAINLYRSALYADPGNEEAKKKLEIAESRRYVDQQAFSRVREGMKESDVRTILGLPREDWIRQKIEGERVYSVWIYPRKDGGAAAVYFEGGIAYHTNWNAAPAPTPVQEKPDAD